MNVLYSALFILMALSSGLTEWRVIKLERRAKSAEDRIEALEILVAPQFLSDEEYDTLNGDFDL